MVENKNQGTEEDALFSLELFISKLLRYGVMVAGVLILIGWLTQIDFHQDTFAHYRDYVPAPLFQTLANLWATNQYGLLTAYAGLIALISLPLIRVVMTGAVFIKQKDYLLAGVVGLVLFGLLLSFFLGYEI